jgi:RimK family alpha-L-glutamate ligase
MLRSPDRVRPKQRRFRVRVALFSGARDWHARQLRAAFARRDIDTVPLPLESCDFDTREACGLRLGNLAGLPDGAIVRAVSAGSFEAVTRRLGVLHALTALGVPVWNEAAAIERCVDKSTTTFLLQQAGVPVPPSWTVEGIEAARCVVAREGGAGPLVLKPLFGSQGRGLILVRHPDDLPSPETVGDVYHLQRFVGGPGPDYSDFRVLVIAGEPVAAMLRRSKGWVTNVKRGATPLPTPLDRELADLAAAATRATGASFCGVDILRERNGQPHVLEVNSMPAWSGLQTVSPVNVADVLAERFAALLRRSAEKRVA